MSDKDLENKDSEDSKEEESFSVEELWNTLEYAEELERGFLRNAFNPFLVNERMKDITLNPLEADSAKVQNALKNPKESEEELRGYSESFELNSMIYKRMLNYLSNLLSFDLTYVCINEDVDYRSIRYKNAEKKVIKFLDRFDVVEEFKKVMKQLLRQEAFFCILRDDGKKYVLQELPNKHCKIDGRFDYGLMFAFDMLWFQEPGTDINLYPPVMKEMYNEYLKGDSKYVPSLPTSLRGHSSWTYWVDCSPKDKFWCWKFSPEIATRVPYLSALFADLALQPLLREVQKNVDVISSSKLLVGEVPFIKDNKSGQKKDEIALDPKTLGNFLAILKRGIGDAIKVAAAPLEDMQGISFSTDNENLYKNYLERTVSSSGVGRATFLSEKPTQFEAQLSADVDVFLMNYIYPAFASFLEYYINMETKTYKFKFKFEGSEFSTDRDKRLDTQMKLAEKGIILPQKISAALGMLHQDMIRQMEMGEASDFMDKLTPIINASQASKEDKESIGRPTKSESEISDSGAQTQEDGGNDDRV